MPRHPVRRPHHHARQHGFSLVELLVSLLVGMLVVGALLAGYYVLAVSQRHTRAMAQLTEDASTALAMLRLQLSQAGYSRPVGPGSGRFQRAYSAQSLAACDGAFGDLSKAIGALGCEKTDNDDTLPDAVAVVYEADTSNSVSNGGVPLDCLGNPITASSASPLLLAYHRYYVDTSQVSARRALYCRGPGDATGQAVVENVEDLQIEYGISNDMAAAPARAASYANASTANAAGTLSNAVSVRLCLVVASTDEVMDEKTPYTNCRQHRSFN
jgi:type IV pilus assembly protein PilW